MTGTISIHTPLAGSDTPKPHHQTTLNPISIHTPLAGSDGGLMGITPILTYFNPHSPCGERRPHGDFTTRPPKFQSTLPLRGATKITQTKTQVWNISIHTPLAGSDFDQHAPAVRSGISIHTPLAGSDIFRRAGSPRRRYFNPHSPCGERPPPMAIGATVTLFQSTLPLRGATR